MLSDAMASLLLSLFFMFTPIDLLDPGLMYSLMSLPEIRFSQPTLRRAINSTIMSSYGLILTSFIPTSPSHQSYLLSNAHTTATEAQVSVLLS
jgi:hypothetical protein